LIVGEKYPTYPKIVKHLVLLKEHFRDCMRVEQALPNFNTRVVDTCKQLIEAVDNCVERLNDDAYIAALLHIGIRDTFFTLTESGKYWALLETLYRY
jgi:hypothetical protein